MTFDLRSLGWDAYFAGAYAAYDRATRRPARVIRVDPGVCTVIGESGTVRASLAGPVLAAAAHDPVALPGVGDWVVVHTWPDRRVTVESVLPRRGGVVWAGAATAPDGQVAGPRGQVVGPHGQVVGPHGQAADPHGQVAAPRGQVLAANLDVVAVVEPLDPVPDIGRIERLLALALESGARPVLILTKADAVRRPDAIADRLAAVVAGVPVHPVSARTGDGVAGLRQYLAPGRTVGLLGRCGAGRSSLVDALAGTTVLTIQAVRADGRGRHATTFPTLIPLPGGGVLIDTPGVRAAGLVGAERATAGASREQLHSLNGRVVTDGVDDLATGSG